VTDGVALVRWFLTLVIVKVIAHHSLKPILAVSFRSFSLLLYLLIWTYFYWLWGTFGILPKEPMASLLTGFLTLILIMLFTKRIFTFKGPSKEKKDLTPEILFWGSLAVAIFIRSFIPILDQTEKFTDTMIFQSLLVDRQFPPEDRWLSGMSLNYYYFSHLLFVPLTHLASIPVEWAFNLSVCTVFALSGVAVYGISLGLGTNRKTAFCAAFSIWVLSNWEWVRQILEGHFVKGFSWWNSSRAIEGAITEFPFFSFLLGDFHAHFTALPWMGLTLALVLQFKIAMSEKVTSKIWILGLLLSLSVGSHYAMNPWGLPFIAGLVVLFLGRHLVATMLIGMGAFFLFLPFWLHYDPPVTSIYLVPIHLRSSILELLSHWGLFLVPLTLILFFMISKGTLKVVILILLVSLVLGSLLGAGTGIWLAILGIYGVHRRFQMRNLESILLFGAGILIILCEHIALDRLYGDKLLRLNTVFKFYFIAWWSLAIAVPVILWRNWDLLRNHKVIVVGIIGVCMVFGSVYPIMGTISRTKALRTSLTLDGLVYWKSIFPGEREALNWLRENTGERDVLWEVDGGPYQHFSRMATFSGRPAVLGWVNHEQVWRKNGHQLCLARQADLEEVKNDSSIEKVRHFIQKYKIRWIVVGQLERQFYSEKLLEVLDQFPVSFSSSTTNIYSSM